MQAIILCSIRETKQRKRKKETVGADGSNGKDGIFCGREKMQMSVSYSIGSIGVSGMGDSICGTR